MSAYMQSNHDFAIRVRRRSVLRTTQIAYIYRTLEQSLPRYASGLNERIVKGVSHLSYCFTHVLTKSRLHRPRSKSRLID